MNSNNNQASITASSSQQQRRNDNKHDNDLSKHAANSLKLADNNGAPRAKIRPPKADGTVQQRRRESSSSSGSSGPPSAAQHNADDDDDEKAVQNKVTTFSAARAADLLLSARIEDTSSRQRQSGGMSNEHQQDIDVDTRQFCLAYREVVKFIDQLGVAFAFIAKMMRGRLDYIETLVHSDNKQIAERYRTVERALKYDAGQNAKQTRKQCCSQELLHLNRSLLFMAAFTEQAFKLKDDDKLSGVAVETYNSTMAKYHPFLIKKTIQVALWTLPTKKHMADLLGDIPYDKKVEQSTAMVEQMRAVFNTVDKLYTKHDLQSLA